MDWFIGEERKFLGRHHHHQHRHHPHHNRWLCLVVCDQDSDHFWSSGCSSSGEKIGLSARRSFLGRNHVPPWWCWRRQYSPALKVKYCHGHDHDLNHWSLVMAIVSVMVTAMALPPLWSWHRQCYPSLHRHNIVIIVLCKIFFQCNSKILNILRSRRIMTFCPSVPREAFVSFFWKTEGEKLMEHLWKNAKTSF